MTELRAGYWNSTRRVV